MAYEITAGNEGGAFVMGGSSGAITVAGTLDHETAPSYSLTVAAGDGRGGTATTTVGIVVTNVIELPGAPRNLRATMDGPWVRLDWDAPSDPTLTGYQVLRRRPLDGEPNLLVHEEDTGSIDTFYIDTRVAPETMYAYRVKAINTDGVGPRSNFANITTGALSAPPAPSGLAASVSEEVFTVTWDALGGAALYEVEHRTAGGDQSYATTTSDTMLTIIPEGGPACGTTYEFKVRAYGDGTLLAAEWGEYSEPATVMTDPCNRAPEFVGPYSFSIPENAATSTPVGTVSASDRDQGDEVRYAITAGNGDGKFAIGESSGEITVAGELDHEAVPSYTLTVEASDGRGGTATTTVAITVTDVAEDLPPAPQRPGVTLTDETFGITWGTVEGAADYEVQQRVSGSGDDWALVATTAGLSATYSPSGGVECGTTYEFRVRAYGDGTTYVADWSEPSEAEPYTTEACNRAPEFATSTYSFTVAEDATTTEPVGTVFAADPDDDPVSYEITGGNAAGKFKVSTSTGTIIVAGALDHEAVPSYTLAVEASDGRGGRDTTTVEIAVTDVAEDPAVRSAGTGRYAGGRYVRDHVEHRRRCWALRGAATGVRVERRLGVGCDDGGSVGHVQSVRRRRVRCDVRVPCARLRRWDDVRFRLGDAVRARAIRYRGLQPSSEVPVVVLHAHHIGERGHEHVDRHHIGDRPRRRSGELLDHRRERGRQVRNRDEHGSDHADGNRRS